MTLFDLMPSVWLCVAFVFFCAYLMTGERPFLYCTGGAFFSLCPSVLCMRIYVQTVFFFAYLLTVAAASRIAAVRKKRRSAVALTRIDRNGGYILYKGSVRAAYSRDPAYVFDIGDVLRVTLLTDGTLFADRLR